MARKRTAAQATADAQLEELQRYGVDPAFLERTDVRAALHEQGIGGASAGAGDVSQPEAGTSGTLENGGVVSGPQQLADDDDLKTLEAETQRLEAAHKARKQADKLKREHGETDAGTRQHLADDLQTARGSAQHLAQLQARSVRDRLTGWADRIGAASTPGGIGTLVLILVLLLLLVIPVNGKSRLEWLLDVLFLRAHLMSESEAASAVGAAMAGPSVPAVGAQPGAGLVTGLGGNGSPATGGNATAGAAAGAAFGNGNGAASNPAAAAAILAFPSVDVNTRYINP